jgi:hypothetical protein
MSKNLETKSKLDTKSTRKTSPCESRVAAHMRDVFSYLRKREQKIREEYSIDSMVKNLHWRKYFLVIESSPYRLYG